MKAENYDKVQMLMKQLNSLKEKLELLTRVEKPYVAIKRDGGNETSTWFGNWAAKETYTTASEELTYKYIQDLKTALRTEIGDITLKLSDL